MMTTAQAKSLLEAWPKRVPWFNGDQVIQCSACRSYFSNSLAWKIHRSTGTCDTTRLRRSDLSVWLPPIRVRVKLPNTGTTRRRNTVPDATESGLLIHNQALSREPP